MTTFIATKFIPETDGDRPEIGDVVSEGKDEEEFTVMEVDHTANIYNYLEEHKNKPVDNRGYDKVLFRGHLTRPAVFWILYCNKIKSNK